MGSAGSPGSDSGNGERDLDTAEPRNTNAHDRRKVSVLHGQGAGTGNMNWPHRNMVAMFSSGGGSVLKENGL